MSKCTTNSKQKIFVYQENRSKLTVYNAAQIDSYSTKVDGCSSKPPDNQPKCDFKHDVLERFELYIELKGQDIKHAVEQIINTVIHLSQEPKKFPKFGFIVCTRNPLSSTEIQQYQHKLMKEYNMKLTIKSSPAEFKY